MPSPYAERRDRLVKALPDGHEAFVTTATVNVRYLTGFTGSNGGVLVGRDGRAVFATDGRYTEQAAVEVPDLELIDGRSVGVGLLSRARQDGLRRVGIEAGQVTLAAYDALVAATDGAIELVPARDLVERLRTVKDAGELATLTRACEITSAAFQAVVQRLCAGVTERDVAWWLQASIRDFGGDGLAFDSIVAFGPNSAIPHHQPGERTLVRGDFVKLDFGARLGGYHADMTRTVVVGPPADWQRALYQQVQMIQAACQEAVRVGALPADLDRAAREAIAATGHEAAHGLGHGVGLQIHEQPMLVAGSTAPALVAGTAVTIEPGIYLPGRGGVRIEDTIVVTAEGSSLLTASPRDLIEVG